MFLKVFWRPSIQKRHLGDVQRPILHVRGGPKKCLTFWHGPPPIKVALKGWWYCVCVHTAIHMQKTTTGHLMTMHVMFSEFMRQRLCTLCFPNSCAKDYLTAGGCRECHSSAANEDGYDILWYRSGTLDRRTCLIMSFHFRDGMWLTQEPPCRLMIWTWFHLFIKDDGLRILSGMYNHIVIAVHFQKSTVCISHVSYTDHDLIIPNGEEQSWHSVPNPPSTEAEVERVAIGAARSDGNSRRGVKDNWRVA